MFAVAGRVAVLTAVYLMFLSSVQPADVLVGAALAVLLVAAGERIRGPDGFRTRPPGTTPLGRLAGVPGLIGFTAADMCRGSFDVARFCLGLRPIHPGTVTVPIEPDAPASATAWAIRVGLSPDTVVVDVDDERGTLLLHVLDVRDPDAVRRAQLDSYRRAQRRVFR